MSGEKKFKGKHISTRQINCGISATSLHSNLDLFLFVFVQS